MSSQKSDLPIRSNGHSTAPHAAVQDLRQGERAHPGKIDLGEHKSFEVDPYASPAIYYGESHGPRKPTKTRTFSSVSSPPPIQALRYCPCLEKFVTLTPSD
jgi:hypothetical protein